MLSEWLGPCQQGLGLRLWVFLEGQVSVCDYFGHNCKEFRGQCCDRGINLDHFLCRIFMGDQVSQLTDSDEFSRVCPTSFFGAVDSIEQGATTRQLDLVDQAEYALNEQVSQSCKATGK